ncbi:LOW QUALITY PROTEIN: THAP domain-containing protein 7-like [Camarhynchus parvulus]|uniref:LOW QUALITY PROTEIN: THAP domain-containing protein 7-like n=1 Tax=Geospiza parvula TaxID=87175 RepID=UPI0012381BE1|nr:LOW QUALITY PROTEIN: THAP domain-containing protein 7-like [Camarhynchus parvulus]
MPRHCSAAGCCTRDTRDTRGRGISFHRLPRRDDPRRAQWLENSRRRDPAGGGRWDPSSKYIYFCSQHFEQSCFELVGYSGYHRLKEGAVPTVFAPGPSRPPRPPKSPKPPPEREPPRPPRGARRWRRDPPPAPPPPPVPSDVSCFPRDSKDPGPPPAGDHGGVPALPGPSGSIPETLLVATGDGAAATTPAPARGAPTPAGPRRAAAPPSPSLFMLRLPPRAGSYIQSEHSYQVGSALLWKRRDEAALDALDKAQRQLQAGKRREHRLRLRLAELQRERRAGPEPRRSSKERLEVIGDGGGGGL